MMGHPAESRLIGFLDGSLADGRRRTVAAHLAACQRCRDIVQAHRLHRLALVGETPEAPPALLDRVLATRAAGGGVILPVDLGRERRGSPFTRHRLKVGAMIAAAAAGLVMLTRVPLPSLGLARGLDGVGSTLQELWSDALRTQSYEGPPRLLERPDAPAAVLDPSRMHELTARYETTRYDEHGNLSSVDSLTVLRIRRDGDVWRIGFHEGSPTGDLGVTAVALDARTLAVRTMTRLQAYPDTRRGGAVVTREYALVGNTAVRYLRRHTSNTPPPPGANRGKPDTLTMYQLTPTEGAPLDFGDWGVRVALMTAVPLSRGWLGAFDGTGFSSNYRGGGYLAERQSDSRRVRGSETLMLPIGEVKTWRVEWWGRYGVTPVREYYRQSDGLLAAELTDDFRYGSTDRRLLSVSVP